MRQSNEDKKKKAADDAINDVLFKEAVTRKELARRALEKAAAKAKEAEKKKEPDKRDVYVDSRDAKASSSQDDTMADWDDAKLKEVVNMKKGGQGERCERGQSGWDPGARSVRIAADSGGSLRGDTVAGA